MEERRWSGQQQKDQRRTQRPHEIEGGIPEGEAMLMTLAIILPTAWLRAWAGTYTVGAFVHALRSWLWVSFGC